MSKQRAEYVSQRDRSGTLISEYYGTELKPPLSLKEVEKYEAHIGNRLPENLREYLLNVSREFVGDNECDCICCCNNIEEFQIDLTTEFMGCKMPEGTKKWDDTYNTPGMITLIPRAHAQRYCMVIKGTNFGTQWYEDAEFMDESVLMEDADFFEDLKKDALEDK